MTDKDLNIIKYRGDSSSSFTGRTEGASARKDSKLDTLDKDSITYSVKIPVGTTAFNPSFYLGFFFPSIKNLGIEKFEEKYLISISSKDEGLRKQLSIDLSEGKRHAINQLKSKGGLLSFIKR